MIGEADRAVRLAVFEWLGDVRAEHDEAIPRRLLEAFELDGRRIPLVGPQGIWKPAVCELPLSITTSPETRYVGDSFDVSKGRLTYAYRGTDAQHPDNRGLRRAMLERVPLVYFFGVRSGVYAAAYPAFVVGDSPDTLTFTVQVDDLAASLRSADERAVAEDPEPRRAYVTATVRRRLHQVAFRERVLRAYRSQCALCRLRHDELLDAAHITPDSEAEGDPVVSNGLALCKLHHAAFDRFFFTVTPDLVIEVRGAILRETDGPMLVVGLQQIHGQRIVLPRQRADWPDPARLEQRYESFRLAS